ncbi:MAG TPA: RICIN domain-containing protein [Nitrospirales bacterium]|jgi:hypothetical protein
MRTKLLFALLFCCSLSAASANASLSENYPVTGGSSVMTLRFTYYAYGGQNTPASGWWKLKPGLGDPGGGGQIHVDVIPNTAAPQAQVSADYIYYPVQIEYHSTFWGIPRAIRDKINVQFKVTARPHWDQAGAIQPQTMPYTTALGDNEGSSGFPFTIQPGGRVWWIHQSVNLSVEVWLDPSIAESFSSGHYLVNLPSTLQTVKRPNSQMAPYLLPLAIIYRPPGDQSWSKMTVSTAVGAKVSVYEGSSNSVAAQDSWGIGPISYTSPTETVTRGSGDDIYQKVSVASFTSYRNNNPMGPGAGDLMIAVVRPTFDLYQSALDRDAVVNQRDNLDQKVIPIRMDTLRISPPGSIPANLTVNEKAELAALDPLLSNPRGPLPTNRYLYVRRAYVPPFVGAGVGGGSQPGQIHGDDVTNAYARSTSTTASEGFTVPLSAIGSLAGPVGGVLPVPDFTSRHTETTTSTVEIRNTVGREITHSILAEYEIADSNPNKELCADVYLDELFGTFAFLDCSTPTQQAGINNAMNQLKVRDRTLNTFQTVASAQAGNFLLAGSLGTAAAQGGTAVLTPLAANQVPIHVAVAKGTGNLVVPNLTPGQYHVQFQNQASTITVSPQGQVTIIPASGPPPAIIMPIRPGGLAAKLDLKPGGTKIKAKQPTNPTIINQNSGKCLDVAAGSLNDQANIQQYACNNGANQRWLLRPVSTGEYQIIAEHSGKCLDVAGGSQADQANVQQYGCHQGANQRWRLTPVGPDVYQIAAASSGKCIDVTGGSKADQANVQQYGCHTGPNQRWQIQGVADLIVPISKKF